MRKTKKEKRSTGATTWAGGQIARWSQPSPPLDPDRALTRQAYVRVFIVLASVLPLAGFIVWRLGPGAVLESAFLVVGPTLLMLFRSIIPWRRYWLPIALLFSGGALLSLGLLAPVAGFDGVPFLVPGVLLWLCLATMILRPSVRAIQRWSAPKN